MAVPDLMALAGMALLVAGAFVLAGTGVALVAAGASLLLIATLVARAAG